MTQTILLNTFLIACLIGSAMAGVAWPSCGGSTSSKDIQLAAPTNPPRECVYHIKATSSYVCQLRIDFGMVLAKPTVPAINNQLTYAQCIDDYFEVDGLRLCGYESQQHIYVNFNRTAGVTKLDLRFVLANRSGFTGLPKPSWNMKVTQLECPSGAAIRSLDIPSGEEEEFEGSLLVPEARASIKDGFFVAPPGCLQYFPQKQGSITSFNFDGGRGIYPGRLNYAICFRRTTSADIVDLSSISFNLNAEYQNMQLDNYCYPQLRTDGASEDYLMIPQATVLQNGVRATYFCGTSANGLTIRSAHPGPLMFIFNSDGIYHSQKEAGFSFTYKLL